MFIHVIFKFFLSVLKENEHLRGALNVQEKQHGMEMDHLHRELHRVVQVRDQYVDFTASILMERDSGAQPGGGGGGGASTGGTGRSGGGKPK